MIILFPPGPIINVATSTQEHDFDLIVVIISRRCGGAFFAGRSHLDEDEWDDDEEGNANEADGV